MSLPSLPRPDSAGPEWRPPAGAVALVWTGALVFVVSLAAFLYAYLVRFGTDAGSGSWIGPALVDVALFSVFALHHSLFARMRLKSRLRRAIPPPYDRSLYTWFASLLLIAVVWWWRPVPGLLYSLQGPWWWAGVALQVTGTALTAAGSRAVDVLDLAGVRPLLSARSGRPPAHVPLATTGVFQIVRHPLYLGWALLVFGAPHMTATRDVFAIVSTAYLALAIPFEERSLGDAFGAEYEAYRRAVKWRMIPWVY